MTIEQIVEKLNYLNGNSNKMPSSQWLYEIEKYENLWCNHPDADKTRFVENSPTTKLEIIGA